MLLVKTHDYELVNNKVKLDLMEEETMTEEEFNDHIKYFLRYGDYVNYIGNDKYVIKPYKDSEVLNLVIKERILEG